MRRATSRQDRVHLYFDAPAESGADANHCAGRDRIHVSAGDWLYETSRLSKFRNCCCSRTCIGDRIAAFSSGRRRTLELSIQATQPPAGPSSLPAAALVWTCLRCASDRRPGDAPVAGIWGLSHALMLRSSAAAGPSSLDCAPSGVRRGAAQPIRSIAAQLNEGRPPKQHNGARIRPDPIQFTYSRQWSNNAIAAGRTQSWLSTMLHRSQPDQEPREIQPAESGHHLVCGLADQNDMLNALPNRLESAVATLCSSASSNGVEPTRRRRPVLPLPLRASVPFKLDIAGSWLYALPFERFH